MTGGRFSCERERDRFRGSLLLVYILDFRNRISSNFMNFLTLRLLVQTEFCADPDLRIAYLLVILFQARTSLIVQVLHSGDERRLTYFDA